MGHLERSAKDAGIGMIQIITGENMIQIVIDKKTPSVNHLYGHNRMGHFYLKKEGRDLREYITSLARKIAVQEKEKIEEIQDCELTLTVEIWEDWFTKKGTIKKKDIANREKFLVDSVFKGLGLDDSAVFEHTMFKVQSDQEKAVLTIGSVSGKL